MEDRSIKIVYTIKFSPIRNGRNLFRPLSLECSPGEIVVLMGPSGIGKSSLLEALAGKLKYCGEVECKNIFKIFQETEQLFPWLTVHENLLLIDKNINWHKISKQWELQGFLNRLPNNCSVGQRQRLTLLRAIYGKYQTLLCDEPMSGVDKETALQICLDFKKLVKQKKKTVVWVTHNENEAKILTKNIIKLKS